jgi:hypothetical protein
MLIVLEVQEVVQRKGDEILYGKEEKMNLYINCFWPVRRVRIVFDIFKIVPGLFSFSFATSKNFLFLSVF